VKFLSFAIASAAAVALVPFSPGLAQDFQEADQAAKKFTLPPGFTIQTWAAEPQLMNPVAFTLDDQGRAFIAETHRFNNSVFDITQNTNWLRNDLAMEKVEDRIQFMTATFGANVGALTSHSERLQMVADSDGDGRADLAKTISENHRQIESGIAAGALARGTNLWFACIPDLWKFYDSDGDGVPEKPVKLHTGFGVHIGVTGHDLHGLVMGPDGRLYFSIGDRGFNVAADGRQLANPHSGATLRCEPDGSNLEIYATGMRNPQELAFDDHGNLFAGDNDTAGPDESRLLYVVEDGDYGWRTPYQHLKDFGPWVLENLWKGGQDGFLPHSGNPAQGPSGLAFYPGTGLPEEYRSHFFICDFPGGIWSFQVAAHGASFELANKTKFVWNCWPTDVEFGPEPGMYFSDWVGGWTMPQKGRIYHLLAKGASRDETLIAPLKASMEEKPAESLQSLLDSPDYRIRQKAQFELARRGDKEALLSVLKHGSVQAQLHALWGLGQIGRRQPNAIRWDSVQFLATADQPELRAQAAKLAEEARLKDAAEDLKHLLKDREPRVRFFAAQALAHLEIKEALPDLIAFARENSGDPFLLHTAAIALARMASPGQLSGMAKDPSIGLRKAVLTAMRRRRDPQVAIFLADAELASSAARGIYDDGMISALPALAQLITKPGLPKAALLRAVHANYRLGDAASARRLADFAAAQDQSKTISAEEAGLRLIAVELLGAWSHPDPIDRVMGYWRPLPARDSEPAKKQLERVWPVLKDAFGGQMLATVIRAARNAGADMPLSEVHAIFADPQAAPEARAEALETMVKRDAGKSESAVVAALRAKDEKLRLLAAKLAARVSSSQVADSLRDIALRDSSIPVKQQALKALKNISPEARGRIAASLAEKWKAQTLEPALQLEVLDLLQTEKEKNAESAQFQRLKHDALLAGGNPSEGARIFADRADVSCSRCHAVRGNGGTVGPDLGQVAASKPLEYLLESIQFPNKQIAKGFEQAIVQNKDGSVFAGLVKSESDSEIVLDSPEDGIVRVAKGDMANRKTALSAMPEGLAEMLTPYELRDLIAYLGSLK
jgi:quinoprotein glucose dehydrogenase